MYTIMCNSAVAAACNGAVTSEVARRQGRNWQKIIPSLYYHIQMWTGSGVVDCVRRIDRRIFGLKRKQTNSQKDPKNKQRRIRNGGSKYRSDASVSVSSTPEGRRHRKNADDVSEQIARRFDRKSAACRRFRKLLSLELSRVSFTSRRRGGTRPTA